MDDSVVLLNDTVEDGAGPSAASGRDDENDDFIVPLPDSVGIEECVATPNTFTHLKRPPRKARTRKVPHEDEEAEAAAERIAEQKALKLAQKQERKEAIERRKAERLEKRLAKESELLLKKQQREATRSRQPKSLIRTIMIIADNRIKKLDNTGNFEEYAKENLLDSTNPLELNFVDAQVPYSISWDLSDSGVPNDCEFDAEEVLIALPITEFIDLVHGSLTGDQNSNLRSYFENVKRVTRKKVILIIVGLEGYLLNYKTLKDRQHRQRCGEDATRSLTKGLKTFVGLKSTISPDQIDRALVDLQMLTSVSHMTAADTKELAVLVQHFTKAVAEKPEKIRKREANTAIGHQQWGFSKLGEDGAGRRELWRRIVMQSCSRQDPPFAEAVVKKYGNPRELLQAYRLCENADLAKNLLSGVDDGGKRRYEMSRRVHMMFTCRDPEAILDKDK